MKLKSYRRRLAGSCAEDRRDAGGTEILASMALLAILVCGPNAAAASLPDKTVPQSCGMQLKKQDCTPETLDEIRGLGIGIVRRGFNWEAIEKEKGVYDFSAHDALLDETRKRGLRVIGCIAFGNKLYGPVREAEGRQAYAKFAAELAGRYKDRNILWEIWNEPNTMTFWGKHGGKGNTEAYALEYTALVKAAVPAMRKADPDCFIMAGSVSCLWSESFNWIEFCFKHGLQESGINAWSVHPYSSKSPEENIENYSKVREIMARHGLPADFPMLNSERGYPIRQTEGWPGGPLNRAQEFQAWHFVRQYQVDLLCDIKATIWYEWSGKDFGIFPQDNTGKEKAMPAYHACKVMLQQLSGYKLARRLPLPSPADFALLFEKDSGERKLVVWTAPAPGQPPDQAREHAVELVAEAPDSAELEACDLFGKPASVAVKNGKLSVTLSGSPQYIRLRGPKP